MNPNPTSTLTPVRYTFERVLKRELFPTDQRSQGVRTYTVLDGASIPDLIDHLYADVRPEFLCLYSGILDPDIAEVAPYLVRLEPDTPFTEWVLEEGWSQHWGIFTHSRANLKAVRRHFRKFLMIRDPDDRSLYFRFYDPRVLRVFFPPCDPEELRFFFGPLESYLCETSHPEKAIRFSLDAGKLKTTMIEETLGF